MKIFITGSNGMLGTEICEQLAKTELIIYASGRGENRVVLENPFSNFHYINLDITDAAKTREAILNLGPNYIIHCAAMTQVDDCEINKSECLRINVDGTKNVLSVAEEINCRFIYVSTDFVFDGNDGPYTEFAEPKPVNFYGESKLLAEELVMQSDIPWTIVRTVLLFGKTDKINRSNFIYWVRDNLHNQKQIKVVQDQIRTPTFIPDLAKGIISIIEKLAVGVYHI
jgi:dTDP-4-dehydrorhamnose reductase